MCFTCVVTASFVAELSLGNAARSASSIFAVAAQAVIYGQFLPRACTRLPFLSRVHDFDEIIYALAKRATPSLLAVITLQALLFGFTTDGVALTLLVAVFKALSWYTMSQAVCDPGN